MSKLGITMSEVRTQPRFARHTQSSLMKTRTPIKLKKKSSSMKDVNKSKKSQEIVSLRLSGIHKRRSNTMKQSKSMQMMIMILKQQQDRRATIFLPGSELIETTFQLENSFVSLQSSLIKDVSCDLKKCTGSPAKLAKSLRDESIKIVNEFEKYTEVSPQDGTNCAERDNLENISFKDYAISRCEVEVLHSKTESEEKPSDSPNEECSEIETQVQDVNAATNRGRTRKFWTYRKFKSWNEHRDIDRTSRIDSQNSKGAKHIDDSQNNFSENNKPVTNDNVITRKRNASQKNQRTWKPPGVSKTWKTESATSSQPILQKSPQKSSIRSKNKYSSTEHIETCSESTSTLMSADQSKMLMKENRDPHANRICGTKMEAKQRPRLQGGGTLPKKRRSNTKIGTKVSDKQADANPTLSKSKSRHCQTRPMPKESTNNLNVEQHHTESTLTRNRRSKTLEVIHTLRKIINNVTEDKDAKENVNDDADHKKDDSEIQTSPNRDTFSQNNELHTLTEDINLNTVDRSSPRSVSTQTELDCVSCQKIDTEKNQDIEEILKLTRIVATQTSPICNRNMVEIGCNTCYIVYNNAEVSCDLIDFTKEIDSPTIEDKLILDSPIHTERSSVKIDVENENANENGELSFGECKEMLNTETIVKLENDNVVIPAKTIIDAIGETEEITYEKVCQVSLKSPLKSSENLDDETKPDIDERQKLTRCSNNHGANDASVNNLFLARSQLSVYDCNASCSSEGIMEYSENDIQYGDTIKSKLTVDSLPSDVIAAFELAAKRMRNLHEAIIIYRNFMLRESEKRNEEMIEGYETSEFRDDPHCFRTYATFTSRENEEMIKSECEAICHFLNNDEDFDGFSTCSSGDSNSNEMCEFERCQRSSLNNYFEIDQEEENAVSPENEQAIARLILNERPDLKNMKSMQMILHRIEEEYALELLQSETNSSDESFETEKKTLALSAAIKKTWLMPNLLFSFALFICVLCTIVFWFLGFSFRCNSKK